MLGRTAYLKELVERRARAAGEELRLRTLMGELGKELSSTRKFLASCDTLIRDYDARLDPTKIHPIRVRTMPAGTYGGLNAGIRMVLQNIYPADLSTREIAILMANRFRLQFYTSVEFSTWKHNSVWAELRRMSRAGQVEKSYELTRKAKRGASRWRLRPATDPSEARLLEQLAAAGEVVPSSDDDPE